MLSYSARLASPPAPRHRSTRPFEMMSRVAAPWRALAQDRARDVQRRVSTECVRTRRDRRRQCPALEHGVVRPVAEADAGEACLLGRRAIASACSKLWLPARVQNVIDLRAVVSLPSSSSLLMLSTLPRCRAECDGRPIISRARLTIQSSMQPK